MIISLVNWLTKLSVKLNFTSVWGGGVRAHVCVYFSKHRIIQSTDSLIPCSLVAYSVGAPNNNSIVKLKSTKLFHFLQHL